MDFFRTKLGEMTVEEIFLYFDRPYIFSCRDATNCVYMVHLVDEDDVAERWFLVPMSETRLEFVRTGKITLRDSVKQPENGWIWEATTPYDGTTGSADIRIASSLESNELPSEGASLNLPENRLPTPRLDAGEEAKRTGRDVLLLALDNGNHSQIIDADHIGSILLHTQGLVRALAYAPKEQAESTLLFVGTYASSIGIRLEAKSALESESVIEKALEAFINLLDMGTATNQNSERSLLLNKRSLTQFKHFLRSLDKADLSVKADWGSPTNGHRFASMTLPQIRETINRLETETENVSQEIVVTGNLIGFISDNDRMRYRFEFVSDEGKLYKGSLDSKLRNQVEHGLSVQIPAYNISVTMEEKVSINPSTLDSRVTYSLLEINAM